MMRLPSLGGGVPPLLFSYLCVWLSVDLWAIGRMALIHWPTPVIHIITELALVLGSRLNALLSAVVIDLGHGLYILHVPEQALIAFWWFNVIRNRTVW